MKTRIRAALMAPFVALTVGLAGCGPSDGMPPSGIVTGTVNYNDSPVAGGTVVFYSVDDPTKNGAAVISPTGTYKVFDAPLGATKVVVLPPAPGAASASDGAPGYARNTIPNRAVVKGAPDELKAKPKTATKPAARVPAKYGKAETTDLKFDVSRGEQEFDIKLAD